MCEEKSTKKREKLLLGSPYGMWKTEAGLMDGPFPE